MKLHSEFFTVLSILYFFYKGLEGSYKDISAYIDKDGTSVREAGLKLKDMGIVSTKPGPTKVQLIVPLNKIKIHDILEQFDLDKKVIALFKDITVEEYFQSISNYGDFNDE